MSFLPVLVSVLIGLLAGAGLVYFLVKKNQTNQVKDLVNQVFGQSAQVIAAQSKELLAGDRDLIGAKLDEKQRAFDSAIKLLHDALREQRKTVTDLELNQKQALSALTEQIKQQRQVTTDLNTSTTQLNAVLSSNQSRGGWGERILEDILQQNGMIEGLHYRRQAVLGQSELKPDITLMLPNDRVVPVDVKFPLSSLQRMTSAVGEKEKTLHSNQFRTDLKDKITQVEKYIRPDLNTFEYALLFVPNEGVFTFINQNYADVIDEAMSRRVLLVSPFSFLVVARTILEGYRAFQFGEKLRFVLSHLTAFEKEWETFATGFEKIGNTIATLQKNFETLTTTRYKALQKRTHKLKDTLTLAVMRDQPKALKE